MSNARIEIRTRDVDNTGPLGTINDWFGPKTKGTPQHLFIVHVDSNARETAIRGGPSMNRTLVDNLNIIKASYDVDFIDYVENAPRVIIAQGTDAEMQVLVDRMWSKAQEINQAGYD